jgi:hypothetical protein
LTSKLPSIMTYPLDMVKYFRKVHGFFSILGYFDSGWKSKTWTHGTIDIVRHSPFPVIPQKCWFSIEFDHRPNVGGIVYQCLTMGHEIWFLEIDLKKSIRPSTNQLSPFKRWFRSQTGPPLHGVQG